MNNLCEKKKPYDKNLELLGRYREGDMAAGETLAELNSPLVYSIAARFSGRGADMSDLVESGNIGLVKEGDTICIDIPAASIRVDVSDEELERRRAEYVAPEPNVKSGWLVRYARQVSGANKGAIMKQ